MTCDKAFLQTFWGVVFCKQFCKHFARQIPVFEFGLQSFCKQNSNVVLSKKENDQDRPDKQTMAVA
jgi:hypothetical protein